jgi:lipopolysaccharide transport system permease protein
MKKIVYTPESALRHPIQLAKTMWQDLLASRRLAWRLAVRDISAQYRQTILGYLWAILPALVTTALWVAINASQILNIQSTDIPYPAFVLTGSILWQLFLDALNMPLRQLGSNRELLIRINFPKESLVLSGLIQVVFSFLIKLLVLTIALIILKVPVQWSALGLIFPVLGFLMLGTLLGVLLVPAGMLYKDVQEGINLIVTPLIYLAPITYPIPGEGLLASLMKMNPLTPLIITSRDLIFGGTFEWLNASFIVCGAALLLLFFGWLVYRLAIPVLVERLQA